MKYLLFCSYLIEHLHLNLLFKEGKFWNLNACLLSTQQRQIQLVRKSITSIFRFGGSLLISPDGVRDDRHDHVHFVHLFLTLTESTQKGWGLAHSCHRSLWLKLGKPVNDDPGFGLWGSFRGCLKLLCLPLLSHHGTWGNLWRGAQG